MIPLRDSLQSYSKPYVTIAIIAANACVFLFQLSLDEFSLNSFIAAYGIIPSRLHASSLLTSMFLHGGWLPHSIPKHLNGVPPGLQRRYFHRQVDLRGVLLRFLLQEVRREPDDSNRARGSVKLADRGFPRGFERNRPRPGQTWMKHILVGLDHGSQSLYPLPILAEVAVHAHHVVDGEAGGMNPGQAIDELEAALIVGAEGVRGRSVEVRHDVQGQQARQQREHEGRVPNPLPRDQQYRGHADQGQQQVECCRVPVRQRVADADNPDLLKRAS